ncbi:MAG: hypothetical protein KGR98_10540, partial [Verrucomicrobia bacterium]|nr:hypothetical protein [Verrucomicrobiota bacterium]
MLPSFVRNVVLCLGFCLASRATLFAQTNYYGAYGTEYPIVGQLPGDQLAADVSLNGSGGFVVWQDNATGRWVVNAERLDATLSGALSAFPVSTATTGDERNPRVAMLKSGGAVFVWQGDSGAFHHIYARFMDSSNIFLTATDMLASVSVTNSQINPAVTVLTNGNVVVAWSSIDEAAQGSMQDVYGRVFSPAGQPLTGEFLMNQFTNFNQDAPAIAALNNGGFVAAWVSEQERALAPNFGDNTNYFAITNYPTPSVDIYARLYDNNASPLGGEFLVNSNFFPCANPAIAAGADGGCMITWCAKDTVNADNSWDIYARSFSRDGNLGPVITVNTHLYGDQYTP